MTSGREGIQTLGVISKLDEVVLCFVELIEWDITAPLRKVGLGGGMIMAIISPVVEDYLPNCSNGPWSYPYAITLK